MENDFHQWLRENLGSDPRLKIGIGDDAAIVDWANANECVVTTDMLADGVHFRLEDVGGKAVGRKCLAVNLSDVAAMACTPVAAFVSLMLPRDQTEQLARDLLTGMEALAREFDVLLAGGDTNAWDGGLVVNVTVIAQPMAKGPLTRSGAVVGDSLLVTGPLGGSIMEHHLTFTPRVALAKQLHESYELHAGMDISDGLVLDASRMAAASGCGVELKMDCIPISQAAMDASHDDSSRSALARALGDGEDFELLLAVDSRHVESIQEGYPGVSLVGHCVETPGVWAVDSTGTRKACEIVGYEHGSKK